MMRMRFVYRRAVTGLLCVGFATFLQGSMCLPNPQPIVDQVTQAFNNALSQLGSTSTQWQMTLNNLENNLVQQGQQTLANQVQSLITRSTAGAFVEVKCTVDFFHSRLSEDLIAILDAFQHKPVPPPVPHFCNVDPSAIDLRLTPSQRPATLNVYGYNLSTSNVTVTVENQNGSSSTAAGFFNVPNEYLATFNIVGYPFLTQNQRVVFTLSNGEKRTIGIDQAPTCGGIGQACCATGTACNPGSGCMSGHCTTCPPPFVPTTKQLLHISDVFDGNNCFGVNNVHHFGGTCDNGQHAEQCLATVVSASSDTSCTVQTFHRNTSNCGCDVLFHSPSDCFKGIHCAITITETTDTPPRPAGCP
jgi:hypothetical protein